MADVDPKELERAQKEELTRTEALTKARKKAAEALTSSVSNQKEFNKALREAISLEKDLEKDTVDFSQEMSEAASSMHELARYAKTLTFNKQLDPAGMAKVAKQIDTIKASLKAAMSVGGPIDEKAVKSAVDQLGIA